MLPLYKCYYYIFILTVSVEQDTCLDSSPIFLTNATFSGGGGVPDDETISEILKRNEIVETAMADVMALEQVTQSDKIAMNDIMR